MEREKQFWSPSTYECFRNNCQCSSACKNYELCQRIAKNKKDGQPPIKKAVANLLAEGISIPVAVTDSLVNCLNVSETKVLKLMVLNNMNRKEISKQLSMPEKTIHGIISNLYDKFSYGFSHTKFTIGNDFNDYAKQELIPELEKLEREGVGC